jgi:hypothetical protein
MLGRSEHLFTFVLLLWTLGVLVAMLYVGINRWLLLGSTVGFCWDRPSAFAGIDRKLQGELC